MTTATVTYHELPPLTSWVSDSQQQQQQEQQQQTHNSPSPTSIPITAFVAAVPLGIEQQDQQSPQVLTDHRHPQQHSLVTSQEIFCTQALNHYRTGQIYILSYFRNRQDSESTLAILLQANFYNFVVNKLLHVCQNLLLQFCISFIVKIISVNLTFINASFSVNMIVGLIIAIVSMLWKFRYFKNLSINPRILCKILFSYDVTFSKMEKR